ncbi:MAG TPA: type II CAAX endopeptidase family protein [Myxococcales bacterium]
METAPHTPEPPPAQRSALAALPAYSLFAFFLLGQVTVAMLLQLASIPLGLALSEVFVFAAPAFLLARAANYKPASFLALRPPPSALLVLLGLLAGASNFVVAGGLQILGRSFVPAEIAKRYDAAHLFQGIGTGELVLVVVALGIFAPLCEEIGFRGWIQPVLRARHGELKAVIITGILFAALHLDPIGMAARIELGVLFGLLAVWTRSLWPAIAAHAANNLIAAGLLVAALTGPERAAQSPTSPLKALGLAAAGLAGVVLILWAVRRVAAKLPEQAPPESADPAEDHLPKAARAGLWIPAWLLAGLACAGALLTLRWTAFQIAIADAASPPQAVTQRLPNDQARKELEKRLLAAKRQAQSGAVDLQAYRAMRGRLAELGKADAGAALSLDEVGAAIDLGSADAGVR